MYISHMRSEGARLLEAIDELIQIAREAKVPAEIYHFKAAGRDNWAKTDCGHRASRSGARAKGCASRPTCTPIRPARRASTRRCRRGCRRAATSVGRRA